MDKKTKRNNETLLRKEKEIRRLKKKLKNKTKKLKNKTKKLKNNKKQLKTLKKMRIKDGEIIKGQGIFSSKEKERLKNEIVALNFILSKNKKTQKYLKKKISKSIQKTRRLNRKLSKGFKNSFKKGFKKGFKRGVKKQSNKYGRRLGLGQQEDLMTQMEIRDTNTTKTPVIAITSSLPNQRKIEEKELLTELETKAKMEKELAQSQAKSQILEKKKNTLQEQLNELQYKEELFMNYKSLNPFFFLLETSKDKKIKKEVQKYCIHFFNMLCAYQDVNVACLRLVFEDSSSDIETFISDIDIANQKMKLKKKELEHIRTENIDEKNKELIELSGKILKLLEDKDEESGYKKRIMMNKEKMEQYILEFKKRLKNGPFNDAIINLIYTPEEMRMNINERPETENHTSSETVNNTSSDTEKVTNVTTLLDVEQQEPINY
jgi:hypothetical protein